MTVPMHIICKLEDIADPGSRAFSVGEGDWPLRGFVVRKGGAVHGYANSCPHAGHPLNWHQHEFLTPDRTMIQCVSHGALFEIGTGKCLAGPCNGRGLRPLSVKVADGLVLLRIERD